MDYSEISIQSDKDMGRKGEKKLGLLAQFVCAIPFCRARMFV